MKLHVKSKIFSIHHKMDILNEDDELVYQVSSKAISMHDKTYLTDAAGREVAYLHAKLISIHNIHYVDMHDGTSFSLSEELFHLRDVIDIDGLGWKLQGDFLAHDFMICSNDGRILATAHRKWVSLHNMYYLDILDESQMDLIVACYVVLEHILSLRQEERADTASHASGNSPAK